MWLRSGNMSLLNLVDMHLLKEDNKKTEICFLGIHFLRVWSFCDIDCSAEWFFRGKFLKKVLATLIKWSMAWCGVASILWQKKQNWFCCEMGFPSKLNRSLADEFFQTVSCQRSSQQKRNIQSWGHSVSSSLSMIWSLETSNSLIQSNPKKQRNTIFFLFGHCYEASSGLQWARKGIVVSSNRISLEWA